MTEESVWAKWARDGKLIRRGALEDIEAFKEGSWTGTTATMNAKVMRELSGAKLLVKSTKNPKVGQVDQHDPIELTTGGKPIWSGTWTGDWRTKPYKIDITFTSGKDKGKTAQGILSFSEDYQSLTICFGMDSGTRPTQFASPENSGYQLLELKR